MEYFDWMSPTNGSGESICFRYDIVDHCLEFHTVEFPGNELLYTDYINRRPYVGRAPHYSPLF